MYNARLTGPAPRVRIDDSNLGIALGGANADTLSIQRAPAGGATLATPISLHLAAAGAAHAWVDAAGLHAAVLTADVFTNLVDSWESTSVFLPPTANALGDAYITLSNLIVTGPNLSNQASWSGALLDTYTSTSVLNAPTANALRAAYYNLSNLLELKLRDAALAAAAGASQAALDTSNMFDNDLWLLSYPDGAPRLYFASGSHSGFAASANPADGYLFRWSRSDYVQDVMLFRAEPDARLEVLGGIVAQGAVSACNGAAVRSELRVEPGGRVVLGDAAAPAGAVRITYSGSNMGINMPAGSNPVFTLHVNGPVCATEDVLTLSDLNAKTDILPLEGPIDALRKIQGCTYRFKGDESGARHIGVIAQDVLCAAPEAVHEDSTGRLSVAYGNLVALVIEGVKALADEVGSIRRELASLCPPMPYQYQQHYPFRAMHYHSHSHVHCTPLQQQCTHHHSPHRPPQPPQHQQYSCRHRRLSQ